MVLYRDRNSTREELIQAGYTWEYMDSWQPKTTLYRHADGLNVQGEVVHPYGSTITGVPGNPDYVLRKARIGFFPYPPTNDPTCCKWCAERAVTIDRGSSSNEKKSVSRRTNEPVKE